PIFSSKVVDTVGAGDAVFSFCAPCWARGADPEMTAFVGNVVGAIAVGIVCNKRPVARHEVAEFAQVLLRRNHNRQGPGTN
ncbi:MAG: hypothetical protein JRI97_05440, partial [Deltaproteobacteria bacterium]|nr:hypothetical protein [Deltaproteobacteria bacterium]